ncbi:bifunctional phosphopantothenoylcysteine decarboxylase/phosphopantothenate--cysteine ligase CoaBC [Corynebacterium tapiri]|uniref:Coenzyme A biosynthesis bifunctional protein CoaBC n=1 Tax=Corynebacterium tapiri TaxID=1448266 RepID=A0A5C4U494_9CORY|nr:bifunctional phosphopantothenoylcysteine decarboxylase/phosphopantothenate--cysteine ligase CoaBC [Corynebacterium tapiri]TNL97790.1 bifunctional phosphopantothenoylcysteine decarboxylase/phosphopantothenate--cysteine ligase CoaBC [Corynebacterium tapiri]
MSEVVIGIGGGIAAYKACHLVRAFKELGHAVTAVPTSSALKFVGAATWEALSGRKVHTDVFEEVDAVNHVAVGQRAELIVIAPATADLLARLAIGRVDDLLTATVLTATCPILVAPAMHTEMWNNQATQDNVATLRRRGIHVMEPAHGRLTGADSGAGRLPEAEQIFALATAVSHRSVGPHDWAGKKVLVTAGGTQEELDPVRYLGNRSSGKQGFAIAEAAAQRGAQVTVIAADTEALPTPVGAEVIRVTSAREMHEAVSARVGGMDVAIMAAAVADYRPAQRADSKLKKGTNDEDLKSLALVENPDILRSVVEQREQGKTKPGLVIVGFAAETGSAENTPLELAERKLQRKGCDILMCNDVSAGGVFGQENNAGWLLRPESTPRSVVEGTKLEIAFDILREVDEAARC